MKDFIKKGLKQIKKEKITPTAKWQFEAKNFFWWSIFSISVLMGGVSVAILLFLIIGLDWQIYTHLGDSFLETFLIIFPHFWFLFLILFIFLSYKNLRCTKKGYSYEWFFVLIAVIAASLLFGAFLHFLGLDNKLNQIFLDTVPGYEKIIHTKEDQWLQPEKGLLSGEIVSQETSGDTLILTLKTFKKEVWQIFIIESTLIKKRAELTKGEKIKIIGKEKKENKTFEATEIRPWEGRGKNRTSVPL